VDEVVLAPGTVRAGVVGFPLLLAGTTFLRMLSYLFEGFVRTAEWLEGVEDPEHNPEDSGVKNGGDGVGS
jgi:hypothetical protein